MWPSHSCSRKTNRFFKFEKLIFCQFFGKFRILFWCSLSTPRCLLVLGYKLFAWVPPIMKKVTWVEIWWSSWPLGWLDKTVPEFEFKPCLDLFLSVWRSAILLKVKFFAVFKTLGLRPKIIFENMKIILPLGVFSEEIPAIHLFCWKRTPNHDFMVIQKLF